MPDVLHAHPLNDLIAHDTSTEDADCPCGPTVRPVEQDGGGYGWLIVHHSLDGREQREAAPDD